MKKVFVGMAIVLFISTNAFAFGLPKILGGDKSSSASGMSTGDLEKNSITLTQDYASATKDLMTSQSKAADAFGLKVLSGQLQAEAEQMGKGNVTSDDVEKNSATTENAQKEISAKVKSGEALGDEGKKELIQSMLYLGKGTAKEVPLVKKVSDLCTSAGQCVKSASPMEIVKVQGIAGTLASISSALTKDLTLSKDTLGLYIDYAKAHGIDVPQDASAAFAQN